MLDWFLNLMESIKSELKGVDNNVRVFRSLINNEIQRYEVQKNGKNVEMDKMVEYNDRIKCLQSLSLILLTYEYDLDELVSVFD